MRAAVSGAKRGVKRLLGAMRLSYFHLMGRCRVPKALFVFMYHAVTRDELRDAQQMAVPVGLLVKQVEALNAYGVPVLPLDDAIRRLGSDDTLIGPIASVVFDDGYENTYTVALPALLDLGVPVTVFLAAKFIGSATPFPFAPPDYGNPLSWDQVSDMARAGIRFGAHGYRHIDLGGASREAIVEDVHRSRATIEDRIDLPVDLFSYPYGGYGSFNRITRDVLVEARFRGACTTVWGRNERGDDPFRLRRLRLSWCDAPLDVWKIMLGCYDWYAGVQRVQGALGRARARPHGAIVDRWGRAAA